MCFERSRSGWLASRWHSGTSVAFSLAHAGAERYSGAGGPSGDEFRSAACSTVCWSAPGGFAMPRGCAVISVAGLLAVVMVTSSAWAQTRPGTAGPPTGYQPAPPPQAWQQPPAPMQQPNQPPMQQMPMSEFQPSGYPEGFYGND